MPSTDLDEQERIAAMAAALRASGSMGRSDLINRLFDFLLEQSLAGRSPKEIEVAREVFGKDHRFDLSQDASVRVHIHRLRRKLDEVYAGAAGERLIIPRGEYRLAIRSPDAQVIDAPPPEPPAEIEEPASRIASRRARWPILFGLAAALVLGVALSPLLWGLRGHAMRPDPLGSTTFWQPFVGGNRPTYLVPGDYYIFGEAPRAAQVTRLVREFSINSREDLDEYLMAHPDDHGRYVDMDLHYLPVSTGYALREVLPLMNNLAGPTGSRPYIITMSRLASEALKGSNIVYVGFLSGLGLLRDPLFEASGFTVGANPEDLIDRASGRHYTADPDEGPGKRSPRRNFAYLASLAGPSGNHILIIAGTRDAAVTQAAEIAVDKVQLDRIAAQAGSGSFEALYEVRTLGTLNLGSTMILARPLKLESVWRPTGVPPPKR